MPKLDSPLQLSPVFKPKIWGRRDLDPIYPEVWTTRRGSTITVRYPQRHGLEGNLIGEVWLTDDNAVFLNGPVAGLTLVEACQRYGRELSGLDNTSGRFPILSKFIFTSEWLSLQVHPDDQYAREHETGSLGKCEMWYIVDAGPDAEFLLGLNPGVTKEALRAALAVGEAPALLRRFHPAPEEAIFVSPGTIHALGPGLILFEAEENSDVTYRLDDFGRTGPEGQPRPLHHKKGLEVIRPELPAYSNRPRFETEEPYGRRRFVLACPYFAVEALRLRKTASFRGPRPRVETLCVVLGEGRVETSAGWYAYRPGDVWLVPPATPSYRIVPEEESCWLKFYVPAMDDDFVKPLSQMGLTPEQIRKVVFA